MNQLVSKKLQGHPRLELLKIWVEIDKDGFISMKPLASTTIITPLIQEIDKEEHPDVVSIRFNGGNTLHLTSSDLIEKIKREKFVGFDSYVVRAYLIHNQTTICWVENTVDREYRNDSNGDPNYDDPYFVYKKIIYIEELSSISSFSVTHQFFYID